MVGRPIPRLVLFAAAAAMLACGTRRPGDSPPPPLPPGVVARPEERWYPVTGLTPGDVLRSIRENGPVADGRRVWGRHDWNLRWTYRYAPAGGACRIREVRVELRSATTMPRWVDRERADSALIRDWDLAMAALRTHENGHRDIAYRAAREVHRAVERVSAPTCGSIAARANARGQEVLRRFKEMNRRYDEETEHGGRQGLVWPAPRSVGTPGGGPGARDGAGGARAS